MDLYRYLFARLFIHFIELVIMIKIGKLADYALLITNYLVVKTDSLCTNDELSKMTHLPIATVRKLLRKLVDAELVTSYRGIKGGYRLSVSPQDISIAQVIIAVEGQIAITECASTNDICNFAYDCNLKENWGILNKFFVNTLSNISLADMSQTLSEQPIKFDVS